MNNNGVTIQRRRGHRYTRKSLARHINKEVSTYLKHTSTELDRAEDAMLEIATKVFDAEENYSAKHEGLLHLDSLAHELSNPQTKDFPLDDWLSVHKHTWSRGTRFLVAAARLLRETVFELCDRHMEIFLPQLHPGLSGLKHCAPELYGNLQRMRRINHPSDEIRSIDKLSPRYRRTFRRVIADFEDAEPSARRPRFCEALAKAAAMAVELRLKLHCSGHNPQFCYEGLSNDMTVDFHSRTSVNGKAWQVIVPAVTGVSKDGTQLIYSRAVVHNDAMTCDECPREWFNMLIRVA